jgi:hypothetical protein
MATGLTPLTELEAVNEMLSTISESPVSTLDENEVIDASIALNILRNTSVEVQTRGWWFNSEFSVSMAPNTAKEIVLPTNILRIDGVATNVIQRGTRLYDRVDRTFKFEAPVVVDQIVALPFDELPSTARILITIRAARKFGDRYGGSESLHTYSAQDEAEARSAMVDEHIDAEDANMLEGSIFMQNLRLRN